MQSMNRFYGFEVFFVLTCHYKMIMDTILMQFVSSESLIFPFWLSLNVIVAYKDFYTNLMKNYVKL